ncbi:YheC/YheD family protein [Marinicrinis lubricantis]|uniref:YheC/YheD family protein n=1 Tax=Marinicrinis lubricantis TaxID=2086470 RepID=A0ABW1IH61_9BACL
MVFSKCTLKFSSKASNTIYLTPSLRKQLRIASRNVTLRFGQKSVSVQVRGLRRTGSQLIVPLSIKNALYIPTGGSCSIEANRGEIQLGPIIGIMTGITKDPNRPFGNRTDYIKQLLNMGGKKAYTYAFSPRSIDWNQGTVVGYFLNPSGGFVRRKVSLPNVIYNRLPSRSAEKSPELNHLKERLVRKRIPLFNWSFFDKWDVYHMLEGTSEYKKYVPESAIDPSPDKIKQMLEKHQFLYLKPTSGSLGIGIYRITYSPKKGYYVRYRKNGKNVLLRIQSFPDLMRMLGHRRGRLSKYVAQQGIRLIEIDRCPIDFRFHMVKNGQGNWVVAAIGAKKAGRGSVTTHLRTGGHLMTPLQALNQVYSPEQSRRILEQAKEASVRLAESIEQNYHHMLGELGFDIGIDQRGNIWMFEANAKPGRSIFKHPALKDSGRSTISQLIDYCVYLSPFASGRGDR